MSADPPAGLTAMVVWRWAWFTVALGAGLFVRLFFISSHGSWDTEYRKAWANETAVEGITRAYGGPDAVPRGEFLAQLSGRLPRWEVSFRGRDFVIDYPPLSLAAWGVSWRFFTSKPRPYRGDEAENVAVKFPAVLGDALAVVALLWAFRGDPPRARWLAAVYWCFPTTWVSSAVHGNFDGFIPPFLIISLVLAGTSPLLAGVMFAVTCLIKPTAVVALPILFLATPALGRKLVVAGGAALTAVVMLPYLFAGTLATAIVHIGRLFSQDRISGGYANPWWLLGHLTMVLRGRAEWADPIDYVRRDAFAWPAGVLGFVAMAWVGAWIMFQARRVCNPGAVAYAAALLLLSWGLLTVGVHDNHNHPLFLLLVATGLQTRFLRRFTAAAATSTLLGSLCLHGLGRFYGPQWKSVLPLADSIARMRMALGFDLTIVLAIVNCALLVVALARLKETLRALEGEG